MLDEITLRALRKDPAERFQSMLDLGTALDRYLDEDHARQRLSTWRGWMRRIAGPGKPREPEETR